MYKKDSKLELVYLNPAELMDHPENRGVVNGPEMEELKLSISELGVIQPLTVRRKEGEIWPEILAGHRRAAAARAIGLAAVPCIVRECSDAEAMAYLFVENFERLSLNAIEEAEGMDAWMRVCDVGVGEVAARIARPVEYVQAMLHLNDLPTPARKLVREGGVSRETLLVLGRVEDECFQAAVQMVLFPSIQSMPLNARQARDVIRNEIELPMKRRREWDAKRARCEVVMRKHCAVKYGMTRLVVPLWSELEAGMYAEGYWELAETEVVDEVLARHGLQLGVQEVCWGELAERHELPGVVKPVDGSDGERVWVRADLCLEGERSMLAAGMQSWLVPVQGAKSEKSAVGRVLDELDADDYDDEEDEGPPDERHVRRESGSMVLVPKDRLERAVEDLGELWSAMMAENVDLDRIDAAQRKIPEALVTHSPITARAVLEWVLAGCPLAGDGEKAAE